MFEVDTKDVFEELEPAGLEPRRVGRRSLYDELNVGHNGELLTE